MKIGISLIVDTTNEEDAQKIVNLLQVFQEQSQSTKEILISRAVRWEVDNAAVEAQRSVGMSPVIASPYGNTSADKVQP